MRQKELYTIKLSDFGISETRGFLPEEDPIISIEPYKIYDANFAILARWERIARNIPKLLAMGKARETIDKEGQYFYENVLKYEPEFNIGDLLDVTDDIRAKECIMRDFSYSGHSYVLEGSEWKTETGHITDRLNPYLALLWHQVASLLGRPPVLSYASYALHNWYRFDATKPIELGNIALIRNFLGGLDEEWFILIHIAIEAKMACIPFAIIEAMRAVDRNDSGKLAYYLDVIMCSLRGMCETAERMWERCDPTFAYYNRVRPYIIGWKNNPALPKGVLYPGVKAYNEQYQQFRGETGAQSSLIPLIDAFFGVQHEQNELTVFLEEMLAYMPAKHREFISTVEKFEKRGHSVWKYILRNKKELSGPAASARTIGKYIDRFLTEHLRFVGEYIAKHKQKNPANPTKTGTGGTPHEAYLKQHREDRRKHFAKLEQ